MREEAKRAELGAKVVREKRLDRKARFAFCRTGRGTSSVPRAVLGEVTFALL
jgi:hypothetical protein